MSQREIKGRIWLGYMDDSASMEYFKLGDDIKVYLGPDSVVMMFTDLWDKNGKPIYEGDIVNDSEHGICKIVYFNGRYMMEVLNTGAKWSISMGVRDGIVFGIEVLGNIYENRELLP